MTREAVVFENGENIPIELNRGRAFDFGDGNRFGVVIVASGFGGANWFCAEEKEPGEDE